MNVACKDEHVCLVINYRLSLADQGKHVSVCSKQTEVCRFHFQRNKWKLLLLLVPFSVGGIPETWSHRHEDIEK
jgi:hypothetical protein